MKLSFSSKKVWYYIVVLTPIVDTINGYFLYTKGITEASGATSSASIGTYYRALAILIMLYFSLIKHPSKWNIISVNILMYFPIVSVIKGLIDRAIFSYLSYALKWIYPPLLIIGFFSAYKFDLNTGLDDVKKVLYIFSYSFPFLLIFEYIFELGRLTYYNAGFKGFFYSTNDISFCLIVGFIVGLSDFFGKYSIRGFLISSINFLAIIILGTKSGILFSVISVFIIWLHNSFQNKKKFIYSILLLGVAMIIGVVTGYRMRDEISNILLRYSNMFIGTIGSSPGSFEKVMAFLTSGRTDRIHKFFSQLLYSKNYVLCFLTGWIRPDNATVIEMDFHDLLCQFGLIGFLILTVTYIKVFKSGIKKKFEYIYIFVLAILSAILGGHIISAALSGTVLAVVICCIYSEKNYKNTNNI